MARIFITGAGAGLGLNTAHALADGGHDVVVHARTDQRLPPGDWRGTVVGDLTDRAETIRAGREANDHGPFDAVIHNAGALHSPAAVAVNTVAPYLLTAVMTLPGRLIYLSSSMHRGGSADLAGLVSGAGSYSDSKLWVTALSIALSDRWPRTVCHAVDPGWVPTRMGGPDAPDSLADGHRTQAWLATATDITPSTGGYWHHRRIQQPAGPARDGSFHARLLLALEEITGVSLP